VIVFDETDPHDAFDVLPLLTMTGPRKQAMAPKRTDELENQEDVAASSGNGRTRPVASCVEALLGRGCPEHGDIAAWLQQKWRRSAVATTDPLPPSSGWHT
jgi:hypothetical protein